MAFDFAAVGGSSGSEGADTAFAHGAASGAGAGVGGWAGADTNLAASTSSCA